MSALDLLGPKLLTKSGEQSTKEALAGAKAVALYFSAHWCGPCRGFTPALAEAYTADLKAKGLEVVFISSDRDEGSFASYYGSMPWLSLPFAERTAKAKLSKKFKVQGIPSLVILDAETGETITRDGREAIMTDPKGANFPWKPPTFWESLGDEFLTGVEGDTVSLDELKASAKVVGLYFSAHWCGPCRGFTPSLITAYKEHLKAKGLEIIFVSSDRDQGSFMSYYKDMPWLAIPAGDPRKEQLSKAFGVQGIPTFVLVDAATGKTITTEARGNVSADPTGADFPWHPKALSNLSAGEGLSSINEEASLCVMLEGCDAAATAAAKAVLEPIAETRKGDLAFFYAPDADGGGPCSKIRELAKLGAATSVPKMLLLDIPDDGGYYVSPATEVTADTVTTFLDMYKAGALERQQLG